jgi:putative endonuclease
MRHHNYYVYIMSSLSRTLYTGMTSDLERRVSEHKLGQPGSFTARYHVNRLVYFEDFRETNQAIAREKEIKRLTRRRKIMLIESVNPEWKDFSQEWLTSPQNPGFLARQPRAGMTAEDSGVMEVSPPP